MGNVLNNILITLVIGMLLYVGTLLLEKPVNGSSPLHSEIFMVDSGYGYRILNGDKILIQQKFIPAVNGKHSFPTKKDAQLVGDLVIYKLMNGHSPVITFNELKDLNVVSWKSK